VAGDEIEPTTSRVSVLGSLYLRVPLRSRVLISTLKRNRESPGMKGNNYGVIDKISILRTRELEALSVFAKEAKKF
jgi:hypothetical protein